MALYSKESDFEKDILNLLPEKGWSKNILKYPTEEALIQNWANILYENNKSIDKLNGCPLTKTEMGQILDQLKLLKTPYKIHSFINGKTIQIVRDNPNDILHLNKTVSLKIYDRKEIAGGKSTYQIAEQPIFKTKDQMSHDRRGDFTFLINGMPVIHVELKRNKSYLKEGINQIIKYTKENIFSGIFSLVQIFVVMTPEETVYFANPGIDGKFINEYMFHWEDSNNEIVSDWRKICEQLLSIPMAHEMIGFYTVADKNDNTLKVLRSYQYNAVKEISKRTANAKWDQEDHKGGHIWHTTGSGKTLTSFKAAQLISSSKDCDKVVFLEDRIELGTQSLSEYKNFADENETVTDTKSSQILLGKLKSSNPSDKLIVTSIQKLAKISKDGAIGPIDMNIINNKRIVIIVDECHRSTFGEMMISIKNVFRKALYFGFSGTPIQDENSKKGVTTKEVFGNELHRYLISDGIRDGNVLGFNIKYCPTFNDDDLRLAVALLKAKANDVEEALNDKKKKKVFYHYMNGVKMNGELDKNDEYINGIEDFIPESQYNNSELKHKREVVKDIFKNFKVISANKFHGILATESIKEAIDYYHLFKEINTSEQTDLPKIKVTAIFDPSIDNTGGYTKEEYLKEIIEDYDNMFEQSFTLVTAKAFKKDVCLRLAHKEQYINLENVRSKQLDIVIVVDQLLTGFDSKWVNILYLDKMLQNEHIVQAFSRTNRVYNKFEKPFGFIKIYKKVNTMKYRIDKAIKTYSGDKPYSVFVDKMFQNIFNMNLVFNSIKEIFENNGIKDFSKLPSSSIDRAKFSVEFNKFDLLINSARLQGMVWDKTKYSDGSNEVVRQFGETEYLALLQRYKELFNDTGGGGDSTPDEPPFALEPSIGTGSVEQINFEYLNSKFKKYLKILEKGNKEERENALNELHKNFAVLSQEEQKVADIIIQDIHNGILIVDSSKTIKDLIAEYLTISHDTNDQKFADFLGIDVNVLKDFLESVDRNNPDSFGRLSAFKNLINKEHLKASLEKKLGKELKNREINMELDIILRKYIKILGFNIDELKYEK